MAASLSETPPDVLPINQAFLKIPRFESFGQQPHLIANGAAGFDSPLDRADGSQGRGMIPVEASPDGLQGMVRIPA